MSQEELMSKRNETEAALLAKVSQSITDDQPQAAEQWTHAYLQLRQAVGIAPQAN